MKDFDKLKAYCEELGLQLLHFTADGHAVYARAPVP